jgi:hypothetical protein
MYPDGTYFVIARPEAVCGRFKMWEAVIMAKVQEVI